MPADALRNTLDHLALDPSAGTDRHYLVTMLRRLGYSEMEIQEALGDEGEEGRVIEVEYSGPGGTQYTFVKEGQATAQFTLADGDSEKATFTLSGDPAAGTEEFSTIDLEDVDVSDDWGDDWGGDAADDDFSTVDREEDAAFEEEDEELVEFTEAGDGLVSFNAEADPALASGWTEVDPGPRKPRVRVLRVRADSAQQAEDFARSEGYEVKGSATLRVDVDEDVDAEWDIENPPGVTYEPSEATGTWDVEAEEAQPSTTGDTWATPEEQEWPEHEPASAFDEVAPVDHDVVDEHEEQWADDVAWNEGDAPQTAAATGAYTEGEYTLYHRELKLTTGRSQDLYFFAKHAPKAGTPCALPDGYEVTASEKTGQPFLRKVDA